MTIAKQQQTAELMLEIAVRIAYLIHLNPSLSEDAVITSARQLVQALRDHSHDRSKV